MKQLLISLTDCTFLNTEFAALWDCPGDAYKTLIILKSGKQMTSENPRSEIEKMLIEGVSYV